MEENYLENKSLDKESILKKYEIEINSLRKEISSLISDKSILSEYNERINYLEKEYKESIEDSFNLPNASMINSALKSYEDLFKMGKEIIIKKAHSK